MKKPTPAQAEHLVTGARKFTPISVEDPWEAELLAGLAQWEDDELGPPEEDDLSDVDIRPLQG